MDLTKILDEILPTPELVEAVDKTTDKIICDTFGDVKNNDLVPIREVRKLVRCQVLTHLQCLELELDHQKAIHDEDCGGW